MSHPGTVAVTKDDGSLFFCPNNLTVTEEKQRGEFEPLTGVKKGKVEIPVATSSTGPNFYGV